MRRSTVGVAALLALGAFACRGCPSSGDGVPSSSSEAEALPGDGADAGTDGVAGEPARHPRDAIGHLVVLYLENHSFDNLYGSWPGAEGRSSPGAIVPQVDRATGKPYRVLPQVERKLPKNLPNAPFDLRRFVGEQQLTIDLVHRFYQQQAQIHGGAMDRFVTVSDAKGLTMAYYPTEGLPLARFLRTMPEHVTMCDHFFHAAFGGSFLNHVWLVAAATPTFPAAPPSVRAKLGKDGSLIDDGMVTPDGFVVNTAYPTHTPRPPSGGQPFVPSQTLPTIADRLLAANVDFAWYAGGFRAALDKAPDPTFKFHHQPFVYFETFKDGAPARSHLRDETEFLSALERGDLPPVSFVKPLGVDDEHPAYATITRSEEHAVALLRAIQASPVWKDTVVIVTYDENGGFFDHVPPPVVDRWGPGARVPTMVISPFARGGVDATVYDTTAILTLIEKRWNLEPLSTRDAAQPDLSEHALRFDGGPPPPAQGRNAQ